MESLWKFRSKKSTPVFSPHAKFSARRKCPRFDGEPVEISLQKINSGFFATRKVSMESLSKSKPASPTTCTFNGADASALYHSSQRFFVAIQNIFSSLPLKSLPCIAIV
jgi:hypothetical protein